MPKPVTTLPKISADGVATAASYTLPAGDDLLAPAPGGSRTAGGATQVLAALAPGRPEKLLLGRRYWS
jgi:penicillin-binding protein 2